MRSVSRQMSGETGRPGRRLSFQSRRGDEGWDQSRGSDHGDRAVRRQSRKHLEAKGMRMSLVWDMMFLRP